MYLLLARMFAHRTHFVHLRSTNAFPNGNFIEASHLGGRAHVIELIRIFEKERPGVPMRVDHGRMMLNRAAVKYIQTKSNRKTNYKGEGLEDSKKRVDDCLFLQSVP